MNRKRIDLNIEELILDGFSSGEAEQIKTSAQEELTRLLAEQGVPERLAANTHIGRIEGGQMDITPGAAPAHTGKQIARAICRTIIR